MKTLLIGGSGFLGTALSKRYKFSNSVTSTSPNVSEKYDLIVCAAPSARKWAANKNPELDHNAIEKLIDRLALLKARRFLLLGTVDVYSDTSAGDEMSPVSPVSNNYGRNRLRVEDMVREQFPEHLVLRLGGLVGTGLLKNPLFDIKNSNNLEMLNAESSMQFTPVEALFQYVQSEEADWMRTINLTAHPISLGEISNLAGVQLSSKVTPIHYNVRSMRFGPNRSYAVDKEDSILAIKKYLRS
jgi:nucleoside-diphosphate-sugar epimerase